MNHSALVEFRRAGRGKGVLFVHTVSADPERWRKYSCMMAQDVRLADWDMWSFGFPTQYAGNVPSIQTLADLLYSRTQLPPLSDCKELVLIAHSMGGLVVQRALVDHGDLVSKVTHVFQFATPNWGLASEWLSSWNPFLSQQLLDMKVDSPFLRNLRAQWEAKFDQLLMIKMLDAVALTDQYHPDPRLIPHAVRRTLPGDHFSIIDADSPEHPSVTIVTQELLKADQEGHSLIFISHSHVDHDLVQRFADAFNARWPSSVWWTPEIPPGAEWEERIKAELRSCTCVTVLWSQASVQSDWVKAEARDAKWRGKLVPIRIGDVPLAEEFQDIQTLDMIGWSGDTGDVRFQRLERAIAAFADEHKKA